MTHQTTDDTPSDFIKFANEHIQSIAKVESLKAHAQNIRSTINVLTEYFSRNQIYIREITAKSLHRLVEFYLNTDKLAKEPYQYPYAI